MNNARKLILAGLIGFGGLAVLGTAAAVIGYIVVAPGLPSIEALRDIRMQVPMRVYTADGRLIAEFGEMKRTPVRYADTPDLMIKAILSAEDDRFFEHPGVDYQGLLRAAINLARTRERTQGGSTITMQVARNFFLSRDKTYMRKLSEIFLALKIEHQLSKEEILELYLNKIYLGNRAYGVVSAAQTYYGVALDDLSVAQMAMIAGLPKAPSIANPIADLERAVIRRNYVLRRMRELGHIDQETFQAALDSPDDAALHGLPLETDARYVAEMARAEIVALYGEELAYTEGFRVYTTIDSRLQDAAVTALRTALHDYDRRHGWRGPEQQVDPAGFADEEAISRFLDRQPVIGGLLPALVVKIEERGATTVIANGEAIDIDWDGLSWARRYIDSNRRGPVPRTAAEILAPGDLVRIAPADDGWRLAQIPQVDGALVALDPHNGAITALAGGYDFRRSHFNRVIQARRQPGSSFKPFIYSAALEQGYTPASIINDAPVVFDDPGLESTWRPGNYSGEFFGPTRLRVGLMNSRNLVSIRLLRAIGINHSIDYMTRFGFEAGTMPRNLSLALGSGEVTPLQLADAYAVFANSGYRVRPYFIERITGHNEELVFEAAPETVCPDCEPEPESDTGLQQVAAGSGIEDPDAEPAPPLRLAPRVITPQNAYLMTSMMRDVIQNGTAVRARQLGRSDLAGKTGTTNDLRDAWFAGYNEDIVAISWVGFDQSQSLGNGETGSRAALPMWIDFMREALQGVPERPLTRPPGLITVRIDPDSGLLAASNQSNGIFETFQVEHAPRQHAAAHAPGRSGGAARGGTQAPEQLF
jgi:penicillin-binding protein 1A